MKPSPPPEFDSDDLIYGLQELYGRDTPELYRQLIALAEWLRNPGNCYVASGMVRRHAEEMAERKGWSEDA